MTASGPECVKTLIASSSWIIDVRWLSDSKVNVAGRIGRDLEHVNAVFTASGMGQNQPFSGRQRFHQTVGIDDFHDPFQVVGEHIQAHLRTNPGQLPRQEVRRTHPLLERPEGMLNRPFSDSHHLRRFAQPKLHFLQYGFMLPASNSSFRARSALRLQRAALAFRTPVTMQLQAFFNVGVVPDQRLASWANVFVFLPRHRRRHRC